MSNSSYTELFFIYHEQFKTIITRTDKLIENIKLNYSLNNEDLKKVSSDVETNLKECDRIINQMTLDINLNGVSSNNGAIKNKRILDICKKEIKDINLLFKKELENRILKKKEEELIIKVLKDKDMSNSNPRMKNDLDDSINEDFVLVNVSNKSNEKLNFIKRTSIDIENRSENIKREIFKQNEHLSDLSFKTKMLQSTIDNSGSLIRKMMMRGNRNKLLLGVFSFTLVCMFVLILYSKF